MIISEIYTKYSIPPNLQEHMLRVCAIIEFIEKHWTGKPVDWKQTRKLALVHDLGNIVRFDFDNHPEFLGKEVKNLDHWKKIQKEMRDKYGLDDHEATRKIIEEIGLRSSEIDTVGSKSFTNSFQTKISSSWPLKLLLYADLRTLPTRIGSLDERITEVKKRRPDIEQNPGIKMAIDSCYDIEKQIQANVDCQLTEINEKSARINNEDLKFEIN